MCHVRVNEKMVLLDAVKDLLGHVCSEADKITINEAVDFFTSDTRQIPDKSVTTTASTGDVRSAEYKTIDQNALIGDSDSVGQNTSTEDCRSESSGRDKGIVAVAGADVATNGDNVAQSVDDGSEVDLSWKLLIRVHSRTKDIPHRYGLHYFVD